VDPAPRRKALGQPFLPGVPKLPNEFLLLNIHRHDPLARAVLSDGLNIDVLEPGVPVGVAAASLPLEISLETVARLAQDLGDEPRADGAALRAELLGESPETLAGPLVARFGVATRRGFDEESEIASEGEILTDGPLAAIAAPSNAQIRDGVLELANY